MLVSASIRCLVAETFYQNRGSYEAQKLRHNLRPYSFYNHVFEEDVP